MRTSIGPSDGGFTCRLALFKFLSTMNDTWAATPCPNSLLSTLAATFRTGAGAASLETVGLASSCAAPAAALESRDRDEMAAPPGERLSAAALASVKCASALAAAPAAAAVAVAAVAAAAVDPAAITAGGAAFAGAESFDGLAAGD